MKRELSGVFNLKTSATRIVSLWTFLHCSHGQTPDEVFKGVWSTTRCGQCEGTKVGCEVPVPAVQVEVFKVQQRE